MRVVPLPPLSSLPKLLYMKTHFISLICSCSSSASYFSSDAAQQSKINRGRKLFLAACWCSASTHSYEWAVGHGGLIPEPS